MKSIDFATTNVEKILLAQAICEPAAINVKQIALDIDEIQGEDPVLIVEDKARRAYALHGKPVVVSDDSWNTPALNGFPGAYMKSINQWFKPEDFLRLMDGIEDRRIILHQYLAYHNGTTIKLFRVDTSGVFVTEPRGNNNKSPNMTVIALDTDGGNTLAEIFSQGDAGVQSLVTNRKDVWHEFAAWYQGQV